MWEFLIHFIDTVTGQIAVYVLLAIFVVVIIQFVRGDWKIIRTKEGKLAFTTTVARTNYDAVKDTTRALQKQTSLYEDMFKKFEQEKAETDRMINQRLQDLFKLTFYSDEIRRIRPCEALRSGIKYIKAGGNGEVKEDVIDYCKEHSELYRGLQAGSKEYHLKELRIGTDV